MKESIFITKSYSSLGCNDFYNAMAKFHDNQNAEDNSDMVMVAMGRRNCVVSCSKTFFFK